MSKKKKNQNTKLTVTEIEKLGTKSSNNKKHGIAAAAVSMVIFFGMLVYLAVMTVVSEKKEFSELENRNLEKFPKFNTEQLFSGKFTDNLETYTADHFYGRDFFVKLKTYCDLALGKRERNGMYILENRLVERVDEPDSELIERSISGLNAFAEDNDIPLFFMLVPTSGDIYSDELPANAPMLDQQKFIEDIYSRLDSEYAVIDAYSAMKLNRDEYIYYRNDHHWTSYGAYLAYEAASKKMGYTPVPLSSYNIEHASSEFKGTLYSSALYDGIDPDIVDYYHCTDGYNITGEYVTEGFGEEPVYYESPYFRDYLDVKDKYSSFTGPNQPLITLKSDSPGGKLLVIKDSYAHCYVPFLMQHYSEVTMFDLRYIQIGYSSIIDVSEYDQVLFLYNASTFSKDDNLRKLAY
ncbi:MAG: hypothetical protein IJ446_10310 [Oscillospiraceae bacterium]|nr:hypothetical protein [Oscillospiraceae bacterium]